MTNEKTITTNRTEMLRLLLNICRNVEQTDAVLQMRKVAAFLHEHREEMNISPDVFGHNRLIVILETILLAVKHIHLRGDILMAAVLWEVLPENLSNDISSTFGKSTAHLFTSLHRVDAIEAKSEALKSENFRNLLVSQAEDMRVILLLIAKCTAVMRKIKDTEAEEAQQILSTEAACVYAPLAHKLGLYQLKSELEDLSLKYLEREAYYHIKEQLNATKKSRDAYIENFISPIREMLTEEGVSFHIKGRTKSIHSIWQKMKKQQCSFNGVYDLFAIRIIVDAPRKKEKEVCWKVFSLITAKYESNLKRLRDWITVPKPNGYESLHITVKGPQEKWVEVQIRTERMDDVAEHGLAAHWRYKGVKAGGSVDAWLSDIRNALETGNDHLLTNSLSEHNSDERDIYVFTPKGDLFRLPPRATVLDFAYFIHTEVGNKCVGAKIDGKNVPIRHRLESGKRVEILTSNNQTPKMEWVNEVASSHAKSKIRTSVRDLQTREATLGRELLERKLKNRKIEWDESIANQLIKKSRFKESFEFYKALYEEELDANVIIDRYQELVKLASGTAERAAIRSAEEFNLEADAARHTSEKQTNDVLVIDSNLKGLDYQFAKCCNPVYGDEVFGFVTSGGGIKIHRVDCPNAPALQTRFDYRIVPAKWAGKGGGKYPITLHVVGNDDLGIVSNISSIISKEAHIMLRSINIDSHDGLFFGLLTVMVDDTYVLNSLIKKLKGVKGVKAVSRA